MAARSTARQLHRWLGLSAGLLFVDFDNGDLLQVAVKAEVVWDGAEVAAG